MLMTKVLKPLHPRHEADPRPHPRAALESDFVSEIRGEEIAVCQQEANQQHYEVRWPLAMDHGS